MKAGRATGKGLLCPVLGAKTAAVMPISNHRDPNLRPVMIRVLGPHTTAIRGARRAAHSFQGYRSATVPSRTTPHQAKVYSLHLVEIPER